MIIIFTESTLAKLAKKHNVNQKEVEQCFVNREGGLLTDDREDHKTNPPTLWFVAPTNKNRILKVAYIQDGKEIIVKTAYEANMEEIRIYEKFAM